MTFKSPRQIGSNKSSSKVFKTLRTGNEWKPNLTLERTLVILLFSVKIQHSNFKFQPSVKERSEKLKMTHNRFDVRHNGSRSTSHSCLWCVLVWKAVFCILLATGKYSWHWSGYSPTQNSDSFPAPYTPNLHMMFTRELIEC